MYILKIQGHHTPNYDSIYAIINTFQNVHYSIIQVIQQELKWCTYLRSLPVKDKFDAKEYENITEFVADFRLMLENCYRYNGPDHYVSKRGQKLETMMEQKLALLSRY